ncbi:MAG: ABC transporter substrate-binding protein [Tropicimonas sp.]|uniref:ABC transporter substrate-binding protein n=1 Tax=Tropicimonas sp. TaxID=2067044 RepID=UPI003A8B328E
MNAFNWTGGRLRSLAVATVLGATLAAAPALARDLRFAFGAPILTLDPGTSAGTQAQTVRYAIMETLVTYEPETMEIVPLLAESWETAEDGVTWTFHLRSGVKFHDGSPLTAGDVAASLNRILDPDGGFGRRSHLAEIAEVAAVDDLTVKIVTRAPSGTLLRVLALDTASVLSAASLEQYGDQVGWNPVGTGAFRYDSHVAEQSITVVRNDDYWGEKAGMDRIVFQIVTEPSTRLAMLEAGEIDVITEVPGFEVARLEEQPGISLIEKASTRVGHIGINTRQGPLTDVRVRQAINFAIDKTAIVQGVLRGLGEPADSVIAPGVNGYAPQDLYSYDPEKAKALLAEAGASDLALTIWTPQGRYFMDRETVVAVQAMLRAVGINAAVEVIDWSTYLAELRKPEGENKSELYWLGWESGTADIQYILDTVFSSERIPPNGWNTMFYDNADVEQMRKDMSVELDPAKRQELADAAQRQIMSDAPWAPVYTYVQVTAYREGLTGLAYLPTDVYILKTVHEE